MSLVMTAAAFLTRLAADGRRTIGDADGPAGEQAGKANGTRPSAAAA